VKLNVVIDGHLGGHVEIRAADDASFCYDSGYLQMPAPTPLSVRFPLRDAAFDSPEVAYWLLNLLPDDDDVIDDWCGTFGGDVACPITLLATPIGVECAGAVQFCTPDRTADLLEAPGGLEPLSEAALWSGLKRLSEDSSFRFAAPYGDSGRSVAGMQPKDALTATDDGWAIPWGRRATTHILKLDRRRWRHETLIEHVTMRSAARIGIPTPPTRLLHGDGLDVIVVERYDRRVLAGTEGPRRIHQEDFCQALGLPPRCRNQGAVDGATVDRCAKILADVVHGDTGDQERMADMVLYRWITGDTDGHAKNFGILLSGSERALAPLYDAASYLPHRRGAEPALPLAMWAGRPGQQRKLHSADTPRSLRQVARALNLAPASVAERVERLAAVTPSAFEATINTLSEEEQTTADGLGLAADVASRAGRCAVIANELNSQIAANASPPPPAHNEPDGSIRFD